MKLFYNYLSLFILLLLMMPHTVNGQAGKTTRKYWIYFDRKDNSVLQKSVSGSAIAENYLTERAIKRRLKVTSPGNVISRADLPLIPAYLDAVAAAGAEIRVRAKWLNAASASATDTQIEYIKKLPFVTRVTPVAVFRGITRLPESPAPMRKPQAPTDHKLSYGPSYEQLDQMSVPAVHDLGITGKGILVGFLDTGYLLSHEAFANTSIVGKYDFIQGDDVVENQTGDVPNEHDHGTATLSCAGAFVEGVMIGSAYGASFLAGKTEDESGETQIEEDNWIAGLMWMDSLGVDIISSSVGYTDWYQPEDMDGQTAAITLAADMAVNRGIIIVNAAGNENGNSWNTIIPPSDGFSVIAVGAATLNNTVASFSSRGPSYDGRTKPDVSALGVGVYLANYSTGGYRYSMGTSYATPLTAGVAALVLSAHPYLSPGQVRQALRATASQSASPDNDLGWGIVNAYDAVLYHGAAFSNVPELTIVETGTKIKTAVAAKSGIGNARLHFNVNGSGFQSTQMQPAAEADYYTAVIPAQSTGDEITMYFSAVDTQGDSANYPYDPSKVLMTFSYGETRIDDIDNNWNHETPETYTLYQNYPNPFNPVTTIEFDLPSNTHVNLSIFSITGQLIRTLVDGNLIAGKKRYRWNGNNDRGIRCASGLYIYRLTAPGYVTSKKLLLIK